jgi:choline dehydrogenase-like flavoprotein
VLATAVTTPMSRGTIRLRSPDPRVAPRIDCNLLAEARDRRRIVEGVKLARRIAGTSPLFDLIDHEISPGTETRHEFEEPAADTRSAMSVSVSINLKIPSAASPSRITVSGEIAAMLWPG